MSIYIGLDLGTTVLKACAFSDAGPALASSSARLLPLTSDDGGREITIAKLDRAFAKAFADLRRVLGKRWAQVAGIGLASQGGSCIIADRDSGAARSPMLLWNDMRFRPYLQSIANAKPAAYWRELAWRNGPGWGLARTRWIEATHPRWLVGNAIYVGAGEYLFHRLTGQWRQDAGNALQIGCYRVSRRAIDEGPLKLIGKGAEFVAPMRRDHETAPLTLAMAKRLGLPAGLPVAGPYMDHEAGFIAASGAGNVLQLSLGTAWVGNIGIPPNTRPASPFQLVLPDPICNGWMVCQPLLTGNVTWDWALGVAGVRATDSDRVIGAAALAPPGLICLPWLNMPNPLLPDIGGAGSFIGVSPLTSRVDLLRAVANGMVCELRRVFSEVIARRQVDSVVIGGGAAQARFFRQLICAAVSPLPVLASRDESSAGARGTLWAFSPKLARCQLAPLPSEPPIDQFNGYYQTYLSAFERVYGKENLGGHLSLGRSRE